MKKKLMLIMIIFAIANTDTANAHWWNEAEKKAETWLDDARTHVKHAWSDIVDYTASFWSEAKADAQEFGKKIGVLSSTHKKVEVHQLQASHAVAVTKSGDAPHEVKEKAKAYKEQSDKAQKAVQKAQKVAAKVIADANTKMVQEVQSVKEAQNAAKAAESALTKAVKDHKKTKAKTKRKADEKSDQKQPTKKLKKS